MGLQERITALAQAIGEDIKEVQAALDLKADQTDTAPLAHVGSSGTSHAAASVSVAGFMSAADKAKLDGIAAGATNYTHPANHPPSIITQDASNRFVTDAEKGVWNSKQDSAPFVAAGATAADARAAIGAGTSNLVIGTTAGTAMAGDAVPFPEAPADGKTYGRKDAGWIEAGGRDAGTQLYTTSQSIPKSTFGTASYVFVELWGGGGSGQAVCTTNSSQNAPGGEGGEYASALIYVSGLSTSTALVIGSGGASVTAVSTKPVAGNNGGDSSFAGLTALGGLGAATSTSGPAKNWLAGKTGGEGGGATLSNSPTSIMRATTGPGGSSVMGGGGGGAGGDVAAYSPAGTSQFAGNGGTGVFFAFSPLTGNNGSIPSGGGSGARLNINGGITTSGAGARGQARLTWW